MTRIDKERFFNMAETYDKMAQELVPQYDFLQDEALKLLNIHPHKESVVIDLGAGSGIFLGKILTKMIKKHLIIAPQLFQDITEYSTLKKTQDLKMEFIRTKNPLKC